MSNNRKVWVHDHILMSFRIVILVSTLYYNLLIILHVSLFVYSTSVLLLKYHVIVYYIKFYKQYIYIYIYTHTMHVYSHFMDCIILMITYLVSYIIIIYIYIYYLYFRFTGSGRECSWYSNNGGICFRILQTYVDRFYTKLGLLHWICVLQIRCHCSRSI